MNSSSSFEGVGIVGIAGAAGALAAAGAAPGFPAGGPAPGFPAAGPAPGFAAAGPAPAPAFAAGGPAAAAGFGEGVSAAESGRDANVARASSENETTPVFNIETPVFLRGRALKSNVERPVVNVYNMSFEQFRGMGGAGRGNHVGRSEGGVIELGIQAPCRVSGVRNAWQQARRDRTAG
jgi:hypothetical protein